jgi:hypothetical protein
LLLRSAPGCFMIRESVGVFCAFFVALLSGRQKHFQTPTYMGRFDGYDRLFEERTPKPDT